MRKVSKISILWQNIYFWLFPVGGPYHIETSPLIYLQHERVKEWLDTDKSVSVYHLKNSTEIYKTISGLAPLIMNRISEIEETNYDLRKKVIFKSHRTIFLWCY